MRLLLVIATCAIAGLYKYLSPVDDKFLGDNCAPAPELHFAPDTSVINAPVVIPQQLIEDKINASIKTELLRDEDFNNINRFTGKADHTKMLVQRTGKIQVSWKNNIATCSAPLAVDAERQIVEQKLLKDGLAVHFNFRIKATFDIAVRVNSDWSLSTQTKFSKLEWIEEPVTEKGNFNLKKWVEKALDKKIPEIEYTIDEQIRNKVNLEKPMTRVWQKLQKPIALNKRHRMLWLQFRPLSVSLANIRTSGTDLILDTRVLTFLQTLAGKYPVFTIDSTLPPLAHTDSWRNHASLRLVAELPYNEINQVFAERLVGQSIQAEGQNLKVTAATLSNCSDLLVAHVKVAGDVSGEFHFCGIPEFRRDSMRLCINRFDYATNTESLLVGGADLLAHDILQSEIQQLMSIGLENEVAMIPGLISAGIENSKAGQSISLSISRFDLRPQKIYVQEDHLTILIAADAQLRIEVERV